MKNDCQDGNIVLENMNPGVKIAATHYFMGGGD
jgi:hypothetical protein